MEAVQLISTVGFPIAMCLLMWHDKRTILKEVKETVKNNTQVLEIIKEKLK